MYRSRNLTTRISLALLACASLLAVAPAQSPAPAGEQRARVDWPQFRGPNRDGVSPETGLLTEWPNAGPHELWRRPLGNGYSGISVARGRAVTLFGHDGSEILAAFDAETGAEQWRYRVDSLYRNGQGDGPRSTPTIDGDRIHALSAHGTLVAVNAETGALEWSVDLGSRYRASGPTWGFATSPLVVDDLLLVDVGGRNQASLVAFDKRDGTESWRALEGKPGYSSPVLVNVGGLRQVVFFTGSSVLAVAPETGDLLWRTPWTTSYDVNAATPIFIPPDRLFISSGYGVGSAVLQITVADGSASIQTTWRNREMKNQFSSSVLHGDYIYGFDNSIMECIDAREGERMWRARGYGHGSLLYADGYLAVLSDTGTLALVEATPEGHVEVARTTVFDSKTWTPPTLANGRLYLRDERQLVALDLATPPGMVQ